MVAYLIAQIDIKDERRYHEYLERYRTDPTAEVTQYGGRYLVVGGAPTSLEGEQPARRFVVAEFPDRESLFSWYNSPGYSSARVLREAASSSQVVVVDGI